MAGFTLIEMLTVLTVIALLAAVATSHLRQEPSRFARQQAAIKLQTAIREAARDSAASGSWKSVRIPQVVAGASVTNTSFPATAAKDEIVLYPDGSASGGTIVLTKRPLVSVDWLTGQVARAQ
jgi:prepilin-type N-terminal cleavage/methylation domain-containing protein